MYTVRMKMEFEWVINLRKKNTNKKERKRSPVVAKNTLKDPPTWLKVATTLEKPPTPTHYN